VNEKLEATKQKIKRYAPLIAAMTGVITVATIIYIRSKSKTTDEPTHTYSYGTDSILKIEATETEAAAFNRALKAFYDAQKRIREETGESWDTRSPLWMNTKRGDTKIYNRLARRFNEAIALINQDETPIEITDDYLTKN